MTKSIYFLHVFFLITSCNQDNKITPQYINTPMLGDIYEMKITPQENDICDPEMRGKWFYTLYKVDKIEGNSIYFKTLKKISSSKSDLATFAKMSDEEYDPGVRQVRDIAILQEMFNKGEILHVKRK